MAVTHFIITKLPDPLEIISKIGVDSIVLNQLYPISRQSELYFERVPALTGFHAKGKLHYKAYDEVNDLYGNEAISNIEWKSPDAPISNSTTISFDDSFTLTLLQALPINGGVEFVEVVKNTRASFMNMSRGGAMQPGSQLTPSELHNSTIFPHIANGSEAKVEYKVGKDGKTTNTIYSLSVDTTNVVTV